MSAPGRDRAVPGTGRASRALVGIIRLYQRLLSPLLGPRCRFAPSCSSYAAEAVRRYGAWRGSGLALRRLAKCHPFHPGGFDPVPSVSPSVGRPNGLGLVERTAYEDLTRSSTSPAGAKRC